LQRRTEDGIQSKKILPMEKPVSFIDALILQSIYHSEEKTKGAELRDIIAYSDYVNHAILTFDELSNGLRNLNSLNLLVPNKKTFKTSSTFKKWWKTKFGKRSRIYVLKEAEEIEKYLISLTEKKSSATDAAQVDITEAEYKLAVNSYLNDANSIISSHQ
jgi:hypothetical protein